MSKQITSEVKYFDYITYLNKDDKIVAISKANNKENKTWVKTNIK